MSEKQGRHAGLHAAKMRPAVIGRSGCVAFFILSHTKYFSDILNSIEVWVRRE